MMKTLPKIQTALPGLLLCGIVTLAALGLEQMEARLLGRAWLESLVLAILLGTAVRTLRGPDARLEPGIQLGAKLLLEIAVVLLGASVSAGALLGHDLSGLRLIAGIAGVVVLAILISYRLGRRFGLSRKMALLIACGNSICGNSAIAAVAPVIEADGQDVAASIAFTAVLGVGVVLGLPLLVGALSLTQAEYGVFAGLTVYAVPQVLAATCPVSASAAQIGTLVKLVRVLMLGPVVLVLSVLQGGLERRRGRARLAVSQLVPWFIVGFLLLLWMRSMDLVPYVLLAPAHAAADGLTVMSMAALGLGVDARAVVRAGGRVALVVVGSLAGLAGVSLGLIRLLGV